MSISLSDASIQICDVKENDKTTGKNEMYNNTKHMV